MSVKFNKDYYDINYFQNGLTVPYKLKVGEVNIYPIKVIDASIYDYAKVLLEIDKNAVNDIDIIKMSYLEFLVKVLFAGENGNDYLNRFLLLMSKCLHEEHIGIIDKEGKFFTYEGKFAIAICDENNTVVGVMTSKDFDIIKKIILFQNDVNYDDRYLDPQVREMVNEYHKLKYKDIHYPSLEKRKAFVISKTGMTLDTINNMTYRMFDEVYQAGVDSEIYLGQKMIQASYKYDVKEDVIHPLYEKKSDPVAEAFVDSSKIEKRITST